MIRIAFLACADTLPGPGPRRGDAFEHDLEIAALRPAFETAGLDLLEIDWREPLEAFDGAALVLLGTAWDYQDYPQDFLAKLDVLAARGITVCNPPEIVRWNADKGYLLDLSERDVPVIPTIWHDDAGRADIADALDRFETDRVVVKRRVHGVLKQAAAGDYRIQSLYGGKESVFAPSTTDLASARAVISALPFKDPLYARIDMARLPSGELAVMEAEMIEPYLYPEQGPDLGERLAKAVLSRLERSA